MNHRQANAGAGGGNRRGILGANGHAVVILSKSFVESNFTLVSIIIIIAVIQSEIHRQPMEGKNSIANLPPRGVPSNVFCCFIIAFDLIFGIVGKPKQ